MYHIKNIWNSFISICSSFGDTVSLSRTLICDELKYLKENKYFEEVLSTIDLHETLQFEQDIKRRQINEFNNSHWKLSVHIKTN